MYVYVYIYTLTHTYIYIYISDRVGNGRRLVDVNVSGLGNPVYGRIEKRRLDCRLGRCCS
jgi:hypothetical protein